MVMKELSIEQKAQRYDEAIERAKDFMNGEVHYALKKGENIMCWVFPQLRESDDVRIRKALMQNLKERFGTKGNMGEGLDMPDVLAWLKKQGEQKPAWSEEDERIRQDIENLIHFALEDGSAVSPAANTTKEGAISWIQSLKDRVQPKQEWSEEDESHIRYLIECLEHCKKGVALTMTTSTSQEYINWLKSLKPQNRWKPSDEQINLLNEVLIFAASHESPHWNDYVFCTLNNLIRQLKKLKEK